MPDVSRPQTTLRDPRRAYRVVDQFEEELADYTGAPYAVTVDSCTNAIWAALMYERSIPVDAGGCGRDVMLPRHTYVGVLQAARNAGYVVRWMHPSAIWYGSYPLTPTRVIDSARWLGKGIYKPNTFRCLSFHAAKQLPLGRGGAILTDDHHAVEWLQRFRADGRAPGDGDPYATFPAAHCYMPPDVAARGLWILSRWNDSGYSPPPLPLEDYRDLSAIAYSAPSKPSGAAPDRITVNP